jgi:PTS system N-acetylglucosamine-specific IIC component
MLGSLALTSFLTGVTEPIEFSFMFLAPALFALHAVLTGLSMVLMDALHVRLGFSFSAGLFDYLINFGKATQPWLLLPVGIGYFGVYYAVFRFAIVRFDLKTPGREPPEEAAPVPVLAGDRPKARGFIEALGGAANLTSVDACTTRLRLVVADQGAVSEPALKALGALGVVRPSARDLQVVLGPIADEMAREMREVLAAAPVAAAVAVTAIEAPMPSAAADPALAAAILTALGGAGNVAVVEAASNRLLVGLADPAAIDEPALRRLGVRGVARTAASRMQLILAGEAASAAAAIGTLIAA